MQGTYLIRFPCLDGTFTVMRPIFNGGWVGATGSGWATTMGAWNTGEEHVSLFELICINERCKNIHVGYKNQIYFS